MEFDKSKILTVVTADQAKVGQKGWFGDSPVEIESEFKMKKPSPLTEIRENVLYPFETDGALTALFYPAPEPSYAERQAQWVMEKQIEIGTRVRITRGFTADEDGSTCVFSTEDDRKKYIVGKVGKVDRIFDDCIVVNIPSGRWTCPFTALEVIKEPTYRPFKNAEEFKPYREKWCLGNLNGRFRIDWHNDTHIYEYGDNFITWEEAFRKYKFEDGTPFGIKEQS